MFSGYIETEKEDGFAYFLAKGIGKAKDITKEGIWNVRWVSESEKIFSY